MDGRTGNYAAARGRNRRAKVRSALRTWKSVAEMDGVSARLACDESVSEAAEGLSPTW